jgi:hypothetical protein
MTRECRLAPRNAYAMPCTDTGRAPATHRRTADQGQPLERSRPQPRHHEPSRPDAGRMEHPSRRVEGFTPGEARRKTNSPLCGQNSRTRPANARSSTIGSSTRRSPTSSSAMRSIAASSSTQARLDNGGSLSGNVSPFACSAIRRILSGPVVTGAMATRSGSRRPRPRL